MKRKVPITLKQFVINQLRRASWRWPPRNQAKNAAKTARNCYTCAICKGSFPNKSVNVDHILPVVSTTTGFVDWNVYIDRLYCNLEGFQVLCDDCHDKKTASEREERKKYK